MAAPFFILRMMAVLDTSQVTAGLRQVQGMVGGAMGGGAGGGPGAFMGAAALAGAAGMFKATQAAIEWEDAMAGVERTLNNTNLPLEEQHARMEALQGDLRDLTREVPISHMEVASMAETAGALGVPEGSIAEFTRVAATISKLSDDLSPDQVAFAMGKIRQIFNLGVDDLNNFGSALTQLGVSGSSTEGEILAMAQMASGAIGLLGGGVEDVMAYSAAFANVGVQSEAGGSAIQKMFLNAGMAVSEGNKHLEKFAGLAGVTSDQFVAMFKSDPAGAINEVVKGMAAAEDPLEALRSVGINQARWTRGWGNVIQAVKNGADITGDLTDNMEVAREGFQNENLFEDMAKKRFDTLANDLQKLSSAFFDIGITLGNTLIPVIQPVVTIFTGFVNSINDLLKAVPGLTAVLGPLIAALSAIVAIRFGHKLLGLLMPMGPMGALLANSWTGLVDTGILAPVSTRMGALKGIMSRKIIEASVGASAAAQLSGMTVGSALVTGITNKLRSVGAGRLIGGALLFGAGQMIAANAGDNIVARFAGSLTNIAAGFAIGGPVGGAAMALIEAVNTVQSMFAEVDRRTAELDAKTAENLKTMTDEQLRASIASLKAMPGRLDAAAGAVYGAADLTQGTIFSGLFGNVAETTERQIAEMETELANRLKGMGSNVADKAGDAGADEIRQMMEELGLNAEEGSQAAVHHIGVARDNIIAAWDQAMQKIAKPPKNIDYATRIRMIQKQIGQAWTQMNKSVKAKDPVNAAFWHQRLTQLKGNIRTMREDSANTLGMAERRWQQHRNNVNSSQTKLRGDTRRTKEVINTELTTAANKVATTGETMQQSLAGVDLSGSATSMMDTYINGIESKIPEVSAVATRVAGAMKGPLHFSTPPPGPLHTIRDWGPHMLDNWLDPVKARLGRVRGVGNSLAEAITPRPQMRPLGAMGVAGGGGMQVHNHYHVGTLIANDKGIDELDDRIERRRKHRRRGAGQRRRET